MDIEINKLTTDKTDGGFLKKVAEKTAKLVKLKISDLSIVIVNDTRMKSINKKYRNKDKTTDVLSFDYGEIVICLPQAKRQAKKNNLSTEQELATLLIHGILHLAGYDDQTKKDYNKMIIKQGGIWQKIKS